MNAKSRHRVMPASFCLYCFIDHKPNRWRIMVATASGANVIVAGSAIFKAPRPRLAMANMREVAEANPYKN